MCYDTIINLSDEELSNIQKDVLCRGVDFGVPRRPGKEEVRSAFEMLYQNLSQFSPHSKDGVAQCRASLEAIAHEYANRDNDLRSFSLRRDHFKALKELRENDRIVISRPDKGRATVIMNASDYVSKMMLILNDTSKLCSRGPVATHDRTANIEMSLTEFLCGLKSSGKIGLMMMFLIQFVRWDLQGRGCMGYQKSTKMVAHSAPYCR